MLSANLPQASPSGFAVVTEYGPRVQGADVGEPYVEGFFTFQTALAVGRGVARLRQVDGGWRAWSVIRACGSTRSKAWRCIF